jgi:hypothetical protein
MGYAKAPRAKKGGWGHVSVAEIIDASACAHLFVASKLLIYKTF